MGLYNSKSKSVNYNSNYIESKYLNRYEELSDIYKQLYQVSTGDSNSTVSLWINLILAQPLSTYIIPELRTNSNEKYGEVINNLDTIFENFEKVFTAKDLSTSIDNKNLDIVKYKSSIDNISNSIWSRGQGNSKIGSKIEFTHRDIIRILKKDVEKFKDEVVKYADSYPNSNWFYKLVVNTKWRHKNYEDFIKNEINSFILKCEIKIREIESALEHLENSKKLITKEISDFKNRGQIIITNFGYMFTEYRTRHNLN